MNDDQHDDHIWLNVDGTSWGIRAIYWPIVYLWRGYDLDLEFCSVDISNVDWDVYNERAVKMLKG
jgi:hypothetical protein